MAGGISAIDETSSLVETGGDDLQMLAAYLGLLGADFSVAEPPELARFAAATAGAGRPRGSQRVPALGGSVAS